MAGKSFRCRLITPAAQVFDEPAVSAVIPAWDGQLGVLPDRAPIVAKLGLGELRVTFANAGKTQSFLVDDGFAQMVNNKLTILAARAIPTDSISESEAQAELREAEARRSDRPEEQKRLAADVARARMKVRMAGQKR